MRVGLLYFEGCPSHARFAPRLRDLVAEADPTAEVIERRVETHGDAEIEGFLGSPTVRIDGQDIDPTAHDRTDFGLKSRLYRHEGAHSGEPPEAWVRAALERSRG
jgi:hypothetical protein